MFYSQIILAKKGPLGKVWMAAHWGEKKISRPQIFNTDIAASVESIVNPQVPLALRVSGHLLLGVVRIYSKQVKYCLTDCHEAMVKIKMAFRKDKKGQSNIDMVMVDPSKRDGNSMGGAVGGSSNNNLNVANFGEYQDFLLDPNALIVDDDGDATGFAIPVDLNQMTDHELAERWVLAEQSQQYNDDSQESRAGGVNGDSQGNTSLESSNNEWSQFNTQLSQTQQEPEEQWRPFNPDAEDLELPPEHKGEDEEEDEVVPMPPPDDEEEEDAPVMMDEDEPVNESRVSEIEVARAADDSIVSENPELRMSIQGDNAKDKRDKNGPVTPGGMSEASFPIPEDDATADLGQIPMPEGDEEEDGNVEVSGIQELSFSRDSNAAGGASAVGGLEESADQPATGPAQPTDEDSDSEATPPPKKKQKKEPGPKRRLIRRKVVIDNDNTELTGEHIKTMLQDTSDIVMAHVPHPADWNGFPSSDSVMSPQSHRGDGSVTTYEESYYSGMASQTQGTEDSMDSTMDPVVYSGIASAIGQNDHLILEHLSFEELMLRPCLGDDGQLAPELLQMWRNNLHAAEGKPCPYPKRSDDDESSEDEEEEEEDNVEVARGAEEESKDGEDETATVDGNATSNGPITQPQDEDDAPMPMPDDEDEAPMPPPEDEQSDDEGGVPIGSDDEAPPVPFGEDEEGKASAKTEGENKYGLGTWGMVNDAIGVTERGGDDDEDDREDEDEPRQEMGTELVSSSTKWHKHTVRVLKLLQRNMGDKDGKKNQDGEDKPDSLIFGELSKNCSRRTAAGVFFEVLQLKTWDFIDVDQSESFGDITISPGVRFAEDPPSS